MLMPARKKPTDHIPRIIAPRLSNGDKRISFGHGLPPAVKEGLRAIAHRENKSMSWVMEEVIIDYFNLKRPKYIDRKPTEKENQDAAEQAARQKHRSSTPSKG